MSNIARNIIFSTRSDWRLQTIELELKKVFCKRPPYTSQNTCLYETFPWMENIKLNGIISPFFYGWFVSNKTRAIIFFDERDLVNYWMLSDLPDKSTKCELWSQTDRVIFSLWFAVGHDFYYIWWLLKEPFVWVGVVSVAWSSPLALNHSWEHFVEVADVSLALLWSDSIPEPVDPLNQLLPVHGFYDDTQKMLQFMPQVLDRIEVGTFGRCWPVI